MNLRKAALIVAFDSKETLLLITGRKNNEPPKQMYTCRDDPIGFIQGDQSRLGG
jgi:hypothetical protein